MHTLDLALITLYDDYFNSSGLDEMTKVLQILRWIEIEGSVGFQQLYH